MLAVCQICGEVFAEISIEGRTDSIAIAPLRYPLNGTMFGSADPFHGVNPPYALSAAVEWEQFRHYGIHRPLIKDDEILTTKGLVKIPKDGSVAYMDGSKPPEIERDKIADAVLQVSDEDAERIVREKMLAEMADTKQAEPEGWVCEICGKELRSKRALQGHMGGAHRGRHG
jgi:hypothetical protein